MPKLSAKPKSIFRCQACGFAAPKWAGQCGDCGAWNSLAEELEAKPNAGRRGLTDFSSPLVQLSQASAEADKRIATGIGELDRLLGGGLVAGQVVLLAGPPGIGKSTLMLQLAESLAKKGKVYYVSGEESLGQVSGRAKRLGVKSEGIYFISETGLERVLETGAGLKAPVWIVDSIQTLCHPDLAGGAGTVGQVRECAAELLRAAKASGSVLFLLGHVTKDGTVAGPRVLEHIVDTVLHFETERHNLLRILRAHKNRFGPTSEIGIFEMGEKGLSEVADASAFFVHDAQAALPGRAISVAMEGSRPLLAEVQALVTPTRYPLPRRMVTGLDQNRTLLLLAALEKHLHLHLESKDVFISLAGGLRLKDTALDLAVCAAVLSSLKEQPAPGDMAFLGEVGLLGEVGRVPMLEARLKEAQRSGFRSAAVPARSEAKQDGLESVGMRRLEDLAGMFGRRS